MSTTISLRQARRLALARAGLLEPERTGLPRRAAGRGKRARAAAHAVVDRFGYLQLDTVSVAGARSHAIVLHSRLEGFDPELAEALLEPGEPLFEYWGHEASWIPLELYPAFEFRRQDYRRAHPWWGDLLTQHRALARQIVERIREEGPLRSLDLEGSSGQGWWQLKEAKKVASALWSAGEIAVRERRSFQRSFDLVERVVPEELLARPLPFAEGLKVLLEKALDGHGWAPTGTLADTWRLRNLRDEIARALAELVEAGAVVACDLVDEEGRRRPGWIRPADLELAAELERIRPRRDRGVLLSPFDPLLWDRQRVKLLFGFDQVLEIFKPAPQRTYGYYCLPVLAGERLVARYDLKAERAEGRLRILAEHVEEVPAAALAAADREAARTALERYAAALGLEISR